MKPKQYTQGWTEFYKLKFHLTPDVLIPRPETELLVDESIKLKPKTVIDLGTGSGNITISIAKNLKDIKIFATDISEKALKVAEKNAKYHKVLNKIIFLKSDLLETFLGSSTLYVSPEYHNNVDVLVTNLPYIPSYRLPNLDHSVIEFEPKIALDGGSDGFDLYRKLFAQMWEKKFFPKHLIGEIDYTQGETAVYEAQKLFPKAKVEVKTDLAHKQRVFIFEFPKTN